MVTTYGDGLDETPTTAGTYSATEGGSGTHLTISALVANDVLKLDDSKGGFVYDAITEKHRPALIRWIMRASTKPTILC